MLIIAKKTRESKEKGWRLGRRGDWAGVTTLNRVVKEGPPDKVSFKSSHGGEGASQE